MTRITITPGSQTYAVATEQTIDAGAVLEGLLTIENTEALYLEACQRWQRWGATPQRYEALAHAAGQQAHENAGLARQRTTYTTNGYARALAVALVQRIQDCPEVWT